MITMRYRFYCGLRDRDGNEVDKRRYLQAMDTLAAGYTIFDSEGVWKGDHESSVVFEVVAATEMEFMSEYQVRAAADLLKAAGKQEAIMVTIEYGVNLLFV